jgi:hypothetical protein
MVSFSNLRLFYFVRLKKQKTFLAFQKIPGYNKENQFSILFLVLKDYSIVRKLGAIITNNTTPNNIFCWFIQAYIKDQENKE